MHSFIWSKHTLPHEELLYVHGITYFCCSPDFIQGKETMHILVIYRFPRAFFWLLNISRRRVRDNVGTVCPFTQLVCTVKVYYCINMLTYYYYDTQFKVHWIHCLNTITDGRLNHLRYMSFSRDRWNLNLFFNYIIYPLRSFRVDVSKLHM